MSARVWGGGRDATLDDSTAGIVRQVLQREVNERINAVNEDFGVGVDEGEEVTVICECAELSCAARITMTTAEYEQVRRFPTRFLVKGGHEIGKGARVVGESDGHVVVEVDGRAGIYAVSTDPRTRSPAAVQEAS